MDKFARLYSWFLLLTSGVAAAARLAGAERMALITSERLESAQKRRRHRLIGIVVIAVSLALLPLFFLLARGQRWMPLAAVVGALSGLEFVVNSARPEPPILRSQNRVFGFLYAVSTVLVYLLLLR